MATVYKRSGTRFLWGKWSDGAGHEQRGSLETADETEALSRVNELERLARGGANGQRVSLPAGLTVEEYARGDWLAMRKKLRPLAWKDDLSRLVHHFFDHLGDKPLKWLETDEGSRALASWAAGLRAHKTQKDGTPLAARSVWNVYSTVKVLLDDAVEDKRLKVN